MIERSAAFASSVVASIPTVCPFSRPLSATLRSTQAKISQCAFTSIRRRVREIVEWSGPVSSSSIRRNRPNTQDG
jgi:hypothetical protein